MATSTEQINDLIQAGNDWKTQADALLADRFAHQQAYEALSGNLRDVVSNQMGFTATFDPAEASPTNERGGTFSSLQLLIDTAPTGAMITVKYPTGGIVNIDEDVTVYGGNLRFVPLDGGTGQIRFLSTLENNENRMRRILLDYGAGVAFQDTDITLQTKSDTGLDWSGHGVAVVRSRAGGQQIKVGLQDTNVQGYLGNALIQSYFGSLVSVSTSNVNLTGNMALVGNAGEGLTFIGRHNLTPATGAVIQDGGTLGTTVFMN